MCPSPRRLHDIQLRFAQAAGSGAFIPPRFLTLPELARRLHQSRGSTRRFRPELKPLLVQNLLAQERKTGTAPVPSIGYCNAVAGFIRDVKLAAADSDLRTTRQTVTKLLDAYEKPRTRALEAFDILERYDSALHRNNWSDDEDILALAAGWVAAGPSLPLLVLDCFVSPSRLEQKLIAALLDRAEKSLALCFGGPDADQSYRLGSDFIRFLKTLSFSVSPLQAPPARPEPPLLRFNSPDDEVAGIARDIKLRSLSGELDITRTVVALPALETFAPLVSRTFREYGIPATIYPTQDLTASPPVVAALELLTALETRYERTSTTAAFASEFLPGLLRLSSDTDGSARTTAAAALNRAAREAGIVKDADAWLHLSERLEPEYGFESEDERSFARDLEKRVKQAIRLTEKMLAGAQTLGEYAVRFKGLLGAAGFCRDLEPHNPESAPLLEDRGELYDILDSLAGFEADFGAQPVDLPGFARTLTYLVGMTHRTAERMPRGVIILSLSETLGLAPEHLYLGALTESNLPSRYPVDPLLPDAVRRKLGLPDIDWHLDRERFHFERTRRSSPAAPWLSYHSAAEGKLVLPTPFFDREPVQAKPALGLFSPEEEQRHRGTESGIALPETVRPVDFGADKDVLAALDSRFGSTRHLSVTRLERYRACPYCFYVNEVLGLEPLEPPSLKIEPQQWGLIVHRALAELYRNGPVPLDQLRSRALASLNQVIGEFGLNRFWTEVTRRLFENNLDDIVECEAGLRAKGFNPAGTEVSLRGEAGPDVLVKGRLDRFDSDGRQIVVLDYKTGSSGAVKPRDVIENRTHLQLPVYCHLLNNIHKDKTIANMGIYSTQEAKVNWLADKGTSVEELISAALANAVEIVGLIRAGKFPALPAKDGTCGNCPQAFLCGKPVPNKHRD